MSSLLQRKPRIFLLSPANLAGIRAGYVMAGDATFDLARRLRAEGVPLGWALSTVPQPLASRAGPPSASALSAAKVALALS